MGNNHCSKDNEVKEKVVEHLYYLRTSFIAYIQNTFNQKKLEFNWDNEIEKWKNEILLYIYNKCNINNKEIQNKMKILENNINLNNQIINNNIIKPKNERKRNINKIDNTKNSNVLMSIEIQKNYSKIIDDFKIFSTKFYDDNEEIENQTFAEFLIKVANISRICFNQSNYILEVLYSKYENLNKPNENNETIISSLDQFKEDFSSWIKTNYEYTEKELEKYFINVKIPYIEEEKDNNTKEYFTKLYKELTILYFQCEISFPSVQVNFFNNEIHFNSETMIDYPHNHGNKNVNFVYFPSLISNDNYLEKGKQWVFTYIENKKKRTFYFEKVDLKLENVYEKKFFIPKLSNKLKLTLHIGKCIIPKINYKISDKVKKEFQYYFIDKNTNEERIIKSDSLIEYNNNLELKKCEFFLMSESILTLK